MKNRFPHPPNPCFRSLGFLQRPPKTGGLWVIRGIPVLTRTVFRHWEDRSARVRTAPECAKRLLMPDRCRGVGMQDMPRDPVTQLRLRMSSGRPSVPERNAPECAAEESSSSASPWLPLGLPLNGCPGAGPPWGLQQEGRLPSPRRLLY